jgi:hypothetical protein
VRLALGCWGWVWNGIVRLEGEGRQWGFRAYAVDVVVLVVAFAGEGGVGGGVQEALARAQGPGWLGSARVGDDVVDGKGEGHGGEEVEDHGDEGGWLRGCLWW